MNKIKIVTILSAIALGSCIGLYGDYMRYQWNGGGWTASYISSGDYGGEVYFNGATCTLNLLYMIHKKHNL